MEVFGLGLKIKEEGAATVEASLKRLALQVTGTVLSIKTITGALNKLVTESVAAQKAQAQLAATLKSTGGVAGQTVDSINDHAAALQRMTAFGDDAIISAQTLLLMFDKIRGETFKQATVAVLNLAQALEMDLNSAALLVGKALQSPEQAATALTRAKIKLTKEQDAVITRLVQTNDVAGAQAKILDILASKTGNAAEAYRNTLGGAIAAVTNAFGDLFEVSQKDSQGIINLLNDLATTLPKIRDFINIMLLRFDVWIAKLLKILTTTGSTFKFLKLAIGEVTGLVRGDALEQAKEEFRASGDMLRGLNEVIAEREKLLADAIAGKKEPTQPAPGGGAPPPPPSGGGNQEEIDKLRLQRFEEREAASLKRRTEEFKAWAEINRRVQAEEAKKLEQIWGFDRIKMQADLGGAEALKLEMQAISTELANIQIPPLDEKLAKAVQVDNIKDTLATTIGSALENGIMSGIEMGMASGNIGDAFKAMGQAIVRSMAQGMVKVAVAAIKLGSLLEKVRLFMMKHPAIAVASAVALLAISRSLGGGATSGDMQAVGGAGGLTYGMGGGGMNSTLPTQQIIFGATSATTAAGMTPRQAMNVTVIGPNDPSAQRAIQELMMKADSRGRLG